MNKKNFKLLLLLLFPLAILLNFLSSQNPQGLENIYSMKLNKWWVQVLSQLSSVFPFSLFEIGIYLSIIGLIIYTLYTLFKILTNWRHGFKLFLHYLLNLGVIGSVAFFVFISFWGLNYKRIHFSEKYGIEAKKDYTPEDLGNLYEYLLRKASSIRSQLPEDQNGLMTTYGNYEDIFYRAHLGYDIASQGFQSLDGNYGSAKPILASELLNYTGITGIYSPFTGEPNVNISVPIVTLPSTTCHEMAHQRGYGFENECNFIAFITCMSHPDLDFQYSGLIMAISYTSNALAKVDWDRLITINKTMDPKVFADLQSINTFWDQYEGEVQEISEQVNNAYLQSNGVDSGTASYGEMVNLLLALYDKYN